MNYKTHKGKSDLETLKNIIEDIEYLRGVGLYPWTGANGRKSMETRFTYKENLVVNGKNIDIDISTTASCKYTRFGVDVTIDGNEKRQYLKALKSL